MRRAGQRPLFLVLLLLGGGAAARSAAEPPAAADSLAAVAPLWPLDLPTRYLTSNFMEYREGRFHAGIDLKTEGRTGWAVRAAEDGSVILLRALPEGYGRAVVLEAGISEGLSKTDPDYLAQIEPYVLYRERWEMA